MMKGTVFAMSLKITEIDSKLLPFEKDLQLRMDNYNNTKKRGKNYV